MKRHLIVLMAALTIGALQIGRAAPPHHLLFSRIGPAQAQLFIANRDGSGERALLPVTGLDYSPALSKDGKWLVFTSERDGSSDLYRINVDGTGLERLTTDPAYDDQAALSPDDRTVAFVSTRGLGKTRIWLLDVATKRAQLLSPSAGGDFRPAWSPDGQWLAFTSDRDSRGTRAPGQWEHLHSTRLYVVRHDGTGLRAITQGAGVIGTPSWSADGKRIIYYETDEIASWYARNGDGANGETQIISIDVATGSTKQHTSGAGVRLWPRVFADGSVAFLVKTGGDAHLSVVSKDGVAVDTSKSTLRNPSWSSDGAQVVYHKVLPVPGGFQMMAAFSRDPEMQMTRIIGGVFPAYSPRGDRVALGVTERPQADGRPVQGPADRNLHIMNADGTDRHLLFAKPGETSFAPAWSPDGSRIAFSLGRYFRAPGHPGGELGLINPDGSGFQSLAKDGSNNGFPSWSPDGRRIVYKKDHHLAILNLADNTVTTLTQPGPQYDNFPQWSPKGDWIMFTSDRDGNADFKLYLIKPDGTGLKKLTDTPGDAHSIWSPDGQWIVFSSARMGFKDERVLAETIPQPYGELFMIRADGTGLRQLTDNQWEDATPAWAPNPVEQRRTAK